VAGKKGDVLPNQKLSGKNAKVLFAQYLADVEMPSFLDDTLYK
jgi:hypothetical protein